MSELANEFFEKPPEPGTPEFEEAKQEAGVVDIFGEAENIFGIALKIGDNELFKNEIFNFIEHLQVACNNAIRNGIFGEAKTLLTKAEELFKKYNINIIQEIREIKEKIIEENMTLLEEHKNDKKILEVLNNLFEYLAGAPMTLDDKYCIFQVARNLIKSGEQLDWQNALLIAVSKRVKAVKELGLEKFRKG